jgi:hypothetical protein
MWGRRKLHLRHGQRRAAGVRSRQTRLRLRQRGAEGLLYPIDGSRFKQSACPQHIEKYLDENDFEAESLIWTLNLDATPIYAIVPAGQQDARTGFERA